MIALLGKLVRSTRGGTAVEYGFILALIVLALIGALITVASTTIDLWSNISTKVTTAGT